MREDLNAYLNNDIHKVKGWCTPQLWQSIWPLFTCVGEGPIAEIGVFEGKFFIGLAKTFDPGGKFDHAAIDVFDMQQFNVDNAGVGKGDIFDLNLEKNRISSNRVQKLRRDSLSLRAADADDLKERFGLFKFFSVDGCHEVTHTMRDIEFAMTVTDHKGIITVDDYLNPDWPGVLEAVSKMYLLRNFAFVPLLFSCNKLFLCSYSYHQAYIDTVRKYINKNHPQTKIKTVTRFGFPTLTVRPDLTRWEPLV